MRNYVLMYNISNKQSENAFINQLKIKFPKYKSIEENNFNYFSFAGNKLPAVKDTLQLIMDILSLEGSDYIALFYTREEEPDNINRLMIFGPSNSMDRDFKKISQTIHERVLGEMLEINFVTNKN